MTTHSGIRLKRVQPAEGKALCPHQRLLSLLLTGAIGNAEYRTLVADLNKREDVSVGRPMKTYRITYASGLQQDWVADSPDAAGVLSKQHGAGNLTILRIEEIGKLDAMPMKPRTMIKPKPFPDLISKLRDTPCNRMAFTPEHADCQCRVAHAAADEIERLKACVDELESRGHCPDCDGDHL